MTTLREAAQQALEAMVSFESGTNGLYEGEFAKEIAALKAALAEPVQEPVAWINSQGDMLRHVPESYGRENEKWTSLYTAPPQRKPLSGVEIQQIELRLRKYHDYDKYDLSLHDFARAIERAHGIGGNNESA